MDPNEEGYVFINANNRKEYECCNRSTQMKVLIAPLEGKLSETESGFRAFEYELISKLTEEGIECYVTAINPPKENMKNIYPIRIKNFSALELYRVSKGLLHDDKVDIIHHFRFLPHSFNLLAIFHDLDKPFICGPAQVPHVVYPDTYTRGKKISKPLINIGFELLKRLKTISTPAINLLMKKTLDKCETLIVVNEDAKRYYSKFVDTDKIVVIPLGVNLTKFGYSIPPNNQEIVTAGSLIKRKGFDYLIKAMETVVKDFPNARLHIFGEGPRRKYLERLVAKMYLNNNVMFHGRMERDAFIKQIKNFRIFVHPSLSEGFSHARLEAMACGRPVVGTNIIGGEMIENGKNGYLVPTRDPDSLAERITELLEDYDLTLRMGRKARETAEKKYDIDKIARKYLNLYERLYGNIS